MSRSPARAGVAAVLSLLILLLATAAATGTAEAKKAAPVTDAEAREMVLALVRTQFVTDGYLNQTGGTMVSETMALTESGRMEGQASVALGTPMAPGTGSLDIEWKGRGRVVDGIPTDSRLRGTTTLVGDSTSTSRGYDIEDQSGAEFDWRFDLTRPEGTTDPDVMTYDLTGLTEKTSTVETGDLRFVIDQRIRSETTAVNPNRLTVDADIVTTYITDAVYTGSYGTHRLRYEIRVHAGAIFPENPNPFGREVEFQELRIDGRPYESDITGDDL